MSRQGCAATFVACVVMALFFAVGVWWVLAEQIP